MKTNILVFLSIFCFAGSLHAQVKKVMPLDRERVQQIAEMLPEQTKGIGHNYKDREVWGRLYQSGKYDQTIFFADSILKKGFPAWRQDLYDRVFTHGDTQSGKTMINTRLRALAILVWSECLENKGRFVPMIREALYDIMAQKSWVNPRNFNQKNYGGLVELATAMNATALSQTVYLLDDKLPEKVKKDVLRSLYTRAYNPIMEALDRKNTDHDHWLTSTGNWNPVCLEGLTVSVLTLISDRMERAKFITMSERYVQNYSLGFTDDGYCSEGINYYNYGMRHYIVLREKILEHTAGKIDLFTQNPKIREIAQFPVNMEIINDVYPAIADCEMDMKPLPVVIYYLNKALGLGFNMEKQEPVGQSDNLTDALICLFPNSSDSVKATEEIISYRLRSYFNDAGVLVVRPFENSVKQMGACLKGGHNKEHHNHNDVGSYTLVVDDRMMIEDPGLIPYNIKTFSAERYTAFKSLASYGHPVPLVAGKLQRNARDARAVIVEMEQTDKTDRIKMDISSVYDVPDLGSLTREFVFNRESVSLTVKDEFTFRKPQVFETAITTRAGWKRDGNKILLERDGRKANAIIETNGCGFNIYEEVISEGGKPYTRLAIRLNERVPDGFIKIIYHIE
jgi:Heparinase II/III-like protein.